MTELQEMILDGIAAHREARGEDPSSDELVRTFRSRRDTTVLRSLEALATTGHVELIRGRWRLKSPVRQLHFELQGDASAGLPPR